ncbi:TPM domain-containing protein [uncultured Robinsoniella sp.]|uniref:TPM domain-containing protein n=1 Tax=uncultured Robinsoniella sp. TaxID=904190 RepID=UPI00374F5649
MVKGRKVLLWICLVFMLLMASGMGVFASSGSQVFDDAGLLSSDQIADLEQKTDILREKYNMNFVVVTTNDAQGKSAREYADDFYMDHGFYDDGEARGGATLLIDMDNREIYISTAHDMIYYMTDDRVESVLDTAYPYIKSGEYYKCLSSMVDATQNFVDKGVPSDQYTENEETGEITRYLSIRPIDWAIAVGAALLLGGAVCGFTVGKYKLKWGSYSYPYKQKGRLNLTNQSDHFTNQIVTQRQIPKNDDSDGSGGGSMSSTHTSSGGGTFGGGGRGF